MTESTPVKVDPKQTVLRREHAHGRPLTACYWEPRARYIFFGAEDNAVHRFELASGKVVSLAAHDSWVRSLGSSPDGEVFYSGGYDGRLIFWPATGEAPRPLRTIEAHQGWIRALAVSPDGRYVATCGNDRQVRLWDAATGERVREYKGHAAHVYNLIFASDSASLISCDLRGVVHCWSLDSDAPRTLVTVEKLHGYDTTFRADIGGARCIALSGDGRQVALGGIMNVTNAFAGVGEVAVALVNLQGKLDGVLEAKDKTKGTMWGVAYHPGGFWIGLSGGGGGGWLFFWQGDASPEFFQLKLKHDGR
ncbi:MAG: WD40 repeat domain-containing protein, partial [Pirellulaceae bacterium]